MKSQSLGPIILDVQGQTLTPEDREILAHPQVGGVILFSRNYDNPIQVRELVQQIRSVRSPLLICVDQEGGRVQRFIKEMTRLPALRILGQLLESDTFDLKDTLIMSQKLGSLMALEIRSLGIDLSFAPVLDLDYQRSEVIGNRAFHSDPKIVTALAKAYILGMANYGMRATGKHFPGHGGVVLDSHLDLPEDTRNLSELQNDIAPFKSLIQADLAGIMPAHIVYPAIDNLPVGFSEIWLQTILRGKLGFTQTIISDDLSMAGAAVIGGYGERAKQALLAGCDYILVCNNRAGAITVIDSLPNIKADAQVLRRRENMLSTGVVSPWEELKASPEWKAAHSVMAQLAQAIVP